jgi:hypothetical protein
MSRKLKKNGVMTSVSLDKNKKYKYSSTGDLVESTTALADNEISISGSKSSLRRVADMERNISILATSMLTTDNGLGVDSPAEVKASAATDATTKANAAQAAAASDATSKANAAQAAAISGAASDATSKANAAQSAAASDATSKANAAQSAAATDATTKANAAQAAAISVVTNGAGAAFDTLVEIQNAMATDAELSSAISSVTSAAASTASADATTKANAALAAALAADSDTTYSVGNGGLTQVNFTTADNTKLDGIATSANNYSLPASVVHASESGALHATDALRISGHTVYLYKGNGTNESVTIPDNNTDTNTTYTAGNGMTLSGTSFLMSGSYTGNFTATGDITAYSDDSLKTNVQLIDGALDRVQAIRGVTFDRISDGTTSTGVIAQELKAVLPEAVHTDANGVHSVAYGNITGLLIEAVKELSAQVNSLKSK